MSAASTIALNGSLENLNNPKVTAHLSGHVGLADVKNAGNLPILLNLRNAPSGLDLDANATASNLGVNGASVSSKSDALDSLESVDSAIHKVNEYRSSLGAMQNRLHSASNNLSIQIENLSDAKSRISDTDIAEEASKLARSNVLQSAGIAVLAQANASPQGILRLL